MIPHVDIPPGGICFIRDVSSACERFSASAPAITRFLRCTEDLATAIDDRQRANVGSNSKAQSFDTGFASRPIPHSETRSEAMKHRYVCWIDSFPDWLGPESFHPPNMSTAAA